MAFSLPLLSSFLKLRNYDDDDEDDDVVAITLMTIETTKTMIMTVT